YVNLKIATCLVRYADDRLIDQRFPRKTMTSTKSKFWASAAVCSEVFAVAAAIITGWFVCFGDEPMLSVFLLPAFVFACGLVAFSVVSRGALRVLRARLTIH
ncbi:hypothetical protein, partial [Burkholderia multivorans]